MPMTPDEHARLARVDERTAAMQTTLATLATIDAKLDLFAEGFARHDERLKVIERGGGSALAVMLALLTALIKDRLHL